MAPPSTSGRVGFPSVVPESTGVKTLDIAVISVPVVSRGKGHRVGTARAGDLQLVPEREGASPSGAAVPVTTLRLEVGKRQPHRTHGKGTSESRALDEASLQPAAAVEVKLAQWAPAANRLRRSLTHVANARRQARATSRHCWRKGGADTSCRVVISCCRGFAPTSLDRVPHALVRKPDR